MSSDGLWSTAPEDADMWSDASIQDHSKVRDPRPWLPKNPGPFVKGQEPWHEYTSEADRQNITERLAAIVLPLEVLAQHPRRDELMWFSRQAEENLYNKSISKMRYIRSAEKRGEFMTKLIEWTRKWQVIRDAGDIPDTHDLETFFHVKSERIKIEPELNNPEGIRGEPLGPENFQHHNFQLTTSDAIQNIPPLNQEEMMDVDEEMMPLAFRAINLN